MKKVWDKQLLQGMEELTVEEKKTITGGESLMFWIGYYVGSIVHALS